MVIITWMQRGAKGAANYGMRAVVKPITERDAAPFIVERAHTDATGGTGWVPASHTHAAAIVCKALLQLAAHPTPAQIAAARDRAPVSSVLPASVPCTIDLGLLDLPEPG